MFELSSEQFLNSASLFQCGGSPMAVLGCHQGVVSSFLLHQLAVVTLVLGQCHTFCMAWNMAHLYDLIYHDLPLKICCDLIGHPSTMVTRTVRPHNNGGLLFGQFFFIQHLVDGRITAPQPWGPIPGWASVWFLKERHETQ